MRMDTIMKGLLGTIALAVVVLVARPWLPSPDPVWAQAQPSSSLPEGKTFESDIPQAWGKLVAVRTKYTHHSDLTANVAVWYMEAADGTIRSIYWTDAGKPVVTVYRRK